MSELTQQKFLDAEGLKYLWQKISLEDYPNNSTLLAVLEAINEEIEAINTKMSIRYDYSEITLEPNITQYVLECQAITLIKCKDFTAFPLGYRASIVCYNPWSNMDIGVNFGCLKPYSDTGIGLGYLHTGLMYDGVKIDIYKSDESGKFNWNISRYPSKAEESEF